MTASTFLIAIAGHSGAGKSTLVKELAARLGGAITLGIDNYPSDSYPRATEWIERGADPNQFQTPQFLEDVRALKAGKAILHPETKQELKPMPFVIIEEPFGRGRSAFREQINLLVYVDTPLEVAHVRKLLRKIDFLPWEDNPPIFMPHLRENLEWYLRIGRTFYVAVSEIARQDCDLIVDGMQPTGQMVEEIMEKISTWGK